MRVLEINERFAEYFEELDYGQMVQLEKSMKADLTSEPVLWWHNPERDRDEILDGHHRYTIAKRCKLELTMHEKHFTSEDEALLFIIRHQTTRRNVINRVQIVKWAIDLESKIGNKTKREVVSEVALLTHVSERTIWRDLEADLQPKNPVEVFKEAKAQLEQVLTREKNKAVAAFKKEVIRDGLDEDAAAGQWQTIEAGIDERYQDKIDEVESLGMAAQEAIENDPILKREVALKRPVKKSRQVLAQKKRDLKSYALLLDKIQALHLDITFDNGLYLPDFRKAYATIETKRAEFPPSKPRFGR